MTKIIPLTPTSEKLITEFDQSAKLWGWNQDLGSGSQVSKAEHEYIEADAKLRQHVSALERKVRRLKQELRLAQQGFYPDPAMNRRDWTKAKAAISAKTISVDILGTGILTEVPNPFYTP